MEVSHIGEINEYAVSLLPLMKASRERVDAVTYPRLEKECGWHWRHYILADKRIQVSTAEALRSRTSAHV
jgi:hypothetical protein